MTYDPQVDDYVIWKRPSGDWDEGWVYFKGDPVDNEKRVKQGWNSVSQYITIETHVKDKPPNDLGPSNGKPTNNPHQKIHCLLLCYEQNWHQLRFVKRRESKVIQHYSQYEYLGIFLKDLD